MLRSRLLRTSAKSEHHANAISAAAGSRFAIPRTCRNASEQHRNERETTSLTDPMVLGILVSNVRDGSGVDNRAMRRDI